ncbi:MAG: tRNA(Ile)-lysidine synthetase [Anaerolineae bacterium]|jgi:uncharacterized protein (TIGR00269 family)
MKCRKCGEVAVINMRQHKLALCADHYLQWVPAQVEKAIHKYEMFTPEDRVLVAVSGGKDSLALWDILLRLGYHADGLYLGLGIDGGFGYSDESQRKCEAFVRRVREAGDRDSGNQGSGNRDSGNQEPGDWPVPVADVLSPDPLIPDSPSPTLHTLSIPDNYGASIPQVAQRVQRGRGKPCSVCGLIKRHEMNRIAYELGYSVLATGHNLDDEAAVLFGNTMTWQVGYLGRQGPVLPESDGFARKVKPLCRMYEREMAAYCLVHGIDYIYEECPYSFGATSIAHKELLAELERKSPGAKQNFYLSFLKAKESGFLDGRQASPPSMHACERCGQPTTAPGLCAFCRLWMEVENKNYRLE